MGVPVQSSRDFHPDGSGAQRALGRRVGCSPPCRLSMVARVRGWVPAMQVYVPVAATGTRPQKIHRNVHSGL